MVFISQSPLKLVDAFDQLYQYATQDADPSAFEPMREPILKGAADFRDRALAIQPRQVEYVIEIASRAWRRPLTEPDRMELHSLYARLRHQEMSHESAIRMMITRVLVAPSFLYRGEKSGTGTEPHPVDQWELATRLSYFLWSSLPDNELRTLADNGRLRDPDTLRVQIRRMTGDPKVRRWATEFGCQWLHVRDLETLDEKSERHFPTFINLRRDMQEEVVRFFIDLVENDRSILSLIDADHSFISGQLATHYGLDVKTDDWKTNQWQRVDGLRDAGRGGILGFAATLAKQSGASRTSPILRGNWLTEVVLGERLPRPPKDTPLLPDETPVGLTERQLIERHSSDTACASCHKRIDPFGFALEGFDAIGRRRVHDSTGLKINTKSELADGVELDGIEGVRNYLLETRRDDFVRQFCRKLVGYSLGRGTQLSDKPLIDEMMRRLEADRYRIGAAIDMIVLSPQFQRVRGQDFVDNE